MVLGLFSKDRALKRAMDKANNKNAQHADRWAAMEKLGDDGSEEALFALLKRFSFSCDKLIEDEQEKQWAVETLINRGEATLPALRRSLKTAGTIAYPLRILTAVTDKQKALEIIDEVLADEEPGYTRDPNKRLQVLEWLGELDGMEPHEILKRVGPYLEDFDENVRFKAAEAISQHPAPEAAEALVTALVNPEDESRRLKIRIAEILCEHKMDLCGKKDEVAAMFDDILSDFHLRHDRLVRRKK